MPARASQASGSAAVVFACALAMATTLAIDCPRAFAGRATLLRKARVVPAQIHRGATEVLEGTLKDGPRHTWRAIMRKPVRFGMMLLGVGAIGAGAKLAGIDPEPYMVSLSVGAAGFSIYKAWPQLKAARGWGRARAIGAHVVWPAGLALGTSAVGVVTGHAEPTGPATLHDAVKSGLQSIVISGDAPTITQGALDPRH